MIFVYCNVVNIIVVILSEIKMRAKIISKGRNFLSSRAHGKKPDEKMLNEKYCTHPDVRLRKKESIAAQSYEVTRSG